MFHRFLVGSLTSEDVEAVHLIRALPTDWAILVRIEAGIRTLRETRRDIPPYLLIHDRAWRQAATQPELLIKGAKKFSYDSLAEFLEQHLNGTFHEHALRVLATAWGATIAAPRMPSTAPRERKPRNTRRRASAAAAASAPSTITPAAA